MASRSGRSTVIWRLDDFFYAAGPVDSGLTSAAESAQLAPPDVFTVEDRRRLVELFRLDERRFLVVVVFLAVVFLAAADVVFFFVAVAVVLALVERFFLAPCMSAGTAIRMTAIRSQSICLSQFPRNAASPRDA